MEITPVVALVRDVVLILASIFGGTYGIYKLLKMQILEIRVDIEVSAEVFHFLNALKLVDVCTTVKNKGKVPIYSKPLGTSDCILEVKVIPNDFNLPIVCDYENFSSLFPPVEFIRDKEFEARYPGFPIVWDPGTTGSNHVIFSTQHEGAILLRARLVDKDGNFFTGIKIVDLTTVTSPNLP